MIDDRELRKIRREREKWFQDRIGKVVYGAKSSCKCQTCKIVYSRSLKIMDKDHASYVHDFEGEINIRYFDTIEERNEFENGNPL